MRGLLALLTIAACGGNGDGGNHTGDGNLDFAASCPAPEPACGGDVTGTWTIVSGCPSLASTLSDCSSIGGSGSGTVTGSFTFGPGDHAWGAEAR